VLGDEYALQQTPCPDLNLLFRTSMECGVPQRVSEDDEACEYIVFVDADESDALSTGVGFFSSSGLWPGF